MKTSNKLLITLFVVGLLTLVGANVALRAEYDQIDFKNPFYGLSTQKIQPFRVLKLEGDKTGVGLLSVQTGNTFEIHLPDKSKHQFTYQSNGDTLTIRYRPENGAGKSRPSYSFTSSPAAVIVAPALEALYTTQISCSLNKVETGNLVLVQKNAGVLLSNSTIGNLTVSNTEGSDLHTRAINQIKTAQITASDSSTVLVERDIFGSLTLETDSLTTVKLPGGLLKKLRQ
ncbi:hypothetical protein ACFPMF_01625 [Larkinella bovis]|uniref:Auto-transporter adhesin head GIN domain-containing protein n=1 Tax=Larkinella bovis TaxID=683041 RepID=A0ABW0I5X5_9BACT